ncbi:MAG TPA: putative baseplate assembly protein [Microlunatus sp.]
MSGPADVDACGCCDAPPVEPAPTNPPGLTRLAYRSGTHGSVLRRMLGAIDRSLPALTVRTADDASIALLDAFATLADVVTFYHERIGNEGYLRTATELRSVLELARSIGYELRPGAAAATLLSFDVLPAEGAPPAAQVWAGLPVRSVPAQGQRPQTYETDEPLEARATGNAVPLRLRGPQLIKAGAKNAYLAGVGTGLAVGDALLFVSGPDGTADPKSVKRAVRLLSTVKPVPARTPEDVDATAVTWADGLPEPWPPGTRVYALRLRASVFGHNAPDFRTMPKDVQLAFEDPKPHPPPPSGTTPTGTTSPTGTSAAGAEPPQWPPRWPRFKLPDEVGQPVLHIDQAYPKLQPGSWLVLREQGKQDLVCKVTDAKLSARTDFALTGRTTRVVLDVKGDELAKFDRREVVVFAAGEDDDWLELTSEPLGGRVTGSDLQVTTVEPFSVGQRVVVTGTTPSGDAVAHLTRIESIPPGGGIISLTNELSRISERGVQQSTVLDRPSVRILANVVTATHGETVQAEVLGSGDGTSSFQRFTLKKKDLTYLTAATAGGVESTLQVRVDGVLWHELASLFLAGPREPAYVVRLSTDGDATVIFGDGEHGSRLPSGQENIVASYRTGIGPAGNAPPGALSLLQQRPLGIVAVTNPIPASGGTPPEVVEDARTNAPLAVLTLDRVVSIEDHADFARAFVGVAKARAVVLWNGTAPVVHVTVAAPDGQTMGPLTLGHLREALDRMRDRSRSVRIDDFVPLRFVVGVAVLVDPTLVFASVGVVVRAAIIDHFALARRDFTQPVTTSEVLATVQAVQGVEAVGLTELHLTTEGAGVRELLIAHDAAHRSPAVGRELRRLDRRPVEPEPFGPDDIRPAELLLLADGEDAVRVTEMTQ